MRNAIINRANPPWKLNARMFKFMLVGFSGTVLDYSLLFLLKALGAPTLLANTCSASAGMLNNFYWNRNLDFLAFGRLEDLPAAIPAILHGQPGGVGHQQPDPDQLGSAPGRAAGKR